MKAAAQPCQRRSSTSDLAADLLAAAERRRARQPASEQWPPADLSQFADMTVVLDEELCRDIADRYESAPHCAFDDALVRQYQQVKQDARLIYQELLAAGVTIKPWSGPGQRYRDSNELVNNVKMTRTLWLFLTANGHGPVSSSAFHPLRGRSGVTASGVELLHNDLVRAAHDLFGHVMFSNDFGPIGEFKAGYCQLSLSSEAARPVLFNEQVAQTCWFYFGAHLRNRCGRLRQPGDQGYLRPRERPYPEQKIFATEPRHLDAFRRMFRVKEM